MKKFRKILVPVDGSGNSQRALAYAGYLAELCQASVDVLHVVNLSVVFPALGQVSTGSYIPDTVFDELQESGRVIVEEAVKKLPSSVTARGLVEVGLPTDVIMAVCAQNSNDLIIMGRRGLGMIKELMLGSVSNHVLQHATCPVMVVK
jgi:nucleotide-binding universal stress UspA family protein